MNNIQFGWFTITMMIVVGVALYNASKGLIPGIVLVVYFIKKFGLDATLALRDVRIEVMENDPECVAVAENAAKITRIICLATEIVMGYFALTSFIM